MVDIHTKITRKIGWWSNMNKFNRCWTPTSLWRAFEQNGSGEYTVLVDKDNIKVTKK